MSFTKRVIVSTTNLSCSYLASQICLKNTFVPRNHGLITQSLGYRHLSNYTRSKQNFNNINGRNFSVYNNVQQGAPLPSQPRPSLSWILGIVLTIILPFAGNKLGPLLQFKNEVDTTVETIEEIVEVVEKVAELVDKVAEGISGDLPATGKLKKVVDIVEYVAEETAKDAHSVEDAIDKFQEVEKKLENIVGPK